MVYQDAGIPRYSLGQSVDLVEICDCKTGENIHPGSLLYPPDSPKFLSLICVRYRKRVTVYDKREVRPDFLGYKAAYCVGTEDENVVTNNYFRYSRSVEFLCGIEPVNHMDYVWRDDCCDRLYIDAAYLIRCYQEYGELYPHLKSFLEK